MKAFLLITTAVVALSGPVLAAGAKKMQSSAAMPATTMEMKPPASEPGGCPHNQPMCGGLVQTQDGRFVRPNRMAQDAREQSVTNDLNRQAQGAAGVGLPYYAPAPQFGAVPTNR